MFEVEYFRHSSPLLDSQDCWHRIGVSSCPHCGKDYQPSDIWEQSPNLIQLIFEPKYRKMGYVVTVSSCPNCKQLSWCHRDLDFWIHHIEFQKEYTPDKVCDIDVKKLKEERDRLIKEKEDEWNRSLCKKCAVKKEVKREKYYTTIKCDGRMGPPSMPDEEPPFLCQRFKEKKPKGI